jgi:hypothetical protein
MTSRAYRVTVCATVFTISRSWLTRGFYFPVPEPAAARRIRPVPRFRLFSRDAIAPEFAGTVRAFDVTLRHVEHAKESLVMAVRSGRVEGIPLANGLAMFEEGLRAADASMPAWRRAETENPWLRCRASLRDALERAERLRLEGSPEIYEELVGEVGDLLDPLEAFAEASAAVRALGRG